MPYQFAASFHKSWRKLGALLHGSLHLNHRQLAVVQDALRGSGEDFPVAAQARRHRVSLGGNLLELEQAPTLHQEAGREEVRLPSRTRPPGPAALTRRWR